MYVKFEITDASTLAPCSFLEKKKIELEYKEEEIGHMVIANDAST